MIIDNAYNENIENKGWIDHENLRICTAKYFVTSIITIDNPVTEILLEIKQVEIR